ELGERGDEIAQRVGLGLADRGVEAAAAASRGDGVPQADFRREQGLEASFIAEWFEGCVDDPADEVTEAVLRLGVGALRGERLLGRKAAEDEDPGIGADDGGEGRFSQRLLALPGPRGW